MNRRYSQGDAVGVSWRDVVLNVSLGLLAMIAILILHINPPTQEDESTPPGNLTVEISWPEGHQADVDLWVKPPEGKAIGYSNRESQIMNLLRDDLGGLRDITPNNMEFAYSRGIMPGEWIVNIHLYNLHGERPPVPVFVMVSLKKDGGRTMPLIRKKRIELTHQGQELTVVRFRLDEDGGLVDGSVNDRQIEIRGIKVNQP
jgi:hypothetical protein